jgi:excisionase family DNA binding protein
MRNTTTRRSRVTRLLDLDEVRRHLNTGRDTCYTLVRSGQLPATKLAGQWRVAPKDLREYMDNVVAVREKS